MSQLFNPIQGKLSKMKSSQMLRCITQPDITPVKGDPKLEYEKENAREFALIHNWNHVQHHKNNDSSLKKLCRLERRSLQKQQSISFYRNELNRRRQKYQDELEREEEKYERELSALEQELILAMKEEQSLDEQNQILTTFLDFIEFKMSAAVNGEGWNLEEFNDSVLEEMEMKLRHIGIIESDLLYSKETIIESQPTNRRVPEVATIIKNRLAPRNQCFSFDNEPNPKATFTNYD